MTIMRPADTFLRIQGEIADLLRTATPSNHAPFFSAFQIFNRDRLQFIDDAVSFLSARITEQTSADELVPKTIHRIWLTGHPGRLPPESYLQRIQKQLIKLADEYNFVFWHNSDFVLSELRKRLPSRNLDFRDIASVGDSVLLSRIQRAVSAQKFVLAGDISKYLILREYGGVYADLGVDFDKPLLDLCRCADVSLFLDQNIFFQPAFMASARSSRPFRIWCDLLAQPEVLGSIAFSPDELTSGKEIWLHGGVGFTAALILFYDFSFSLLPVPPNRGLLHHQSEGSWYKPGGKFGNATIDTAQVTHISRDLLLDYTQKPSGLVGGLANGNSVQLIRARVVRHLKDVFWLKL